MINLYKIFLLDGCGAILSAVSLGLILPYFNEYIGMSASSLYLLAALPVAFAAYSLSCYFFQPAYWRRFLLGIAVANFLYCCLTSALLFRNWGTITNWGVAYFVAEIIVVLVLVYWEWQIAVRK